MDLNINDRVYKVEVTDDESLLTVLRDDLDLTGSKYGCGEGACGACTVLVNGTPTRSCITKVGTLRNAKIVTIEGLEKNGKLHPVQESCLNVDVFQCSYCAPGMIMSAVALLNRTKTPTENEIRTAMQGNVCRCGTHTRIVDAIVEASKV